ncbi:MULTISPECIES: COX15/CtaA family protein [Spongiibacter]|mgnify:FL=1|jgi:cytochrome c oxidase assembly protein subunit 15|uniref:COX15/CtaA family protein n=1 Tax=Spongiibacter TaxID=630749 RepID=UPI000C0B8E89|nr:MULTISPECIES: COX15/CtaA family protein [Spongiibacter]MAK45381.1 cytochrome B [Spongiibacter sp.]MBM7422057.1 cytochrome c oxidase assembly protein subunit 15 [Spongiibacter marinus]|tara:strand:+ start:31110 stop:32159 length:1050 start_codon:yes stop_codon:yes gene_type:complete
MTLFNSPDLRKPGFRLAFSACLVAIIVLGMGVFTRLADAGLGCPDWPGCYGHVLWPTEDHEVARANEAYPEMPVEHDKTWPEMVHRYLATSLGLFTIGILVFALRNRGPEQPLKLPVFLLAFIILQGMFGMWTVTLKLWPQVVTAHLLGGFTTISLLWLLTLRLNNQRWQLPAIVEPKLTALRPLVVVGLLIVVGQIALGGWTTSNYADIACPDFPRCQGAWLPPMDFANGFNIAQQVGPNYLGGVLDNDARVAIHVSHRIGAIITSLYLLFLFVKLRGLATAPAKRLSVVMLAVLVAQVLLGISNIVFNFPIAVAVTHNLVGALLLLVMVTMNYCVFTATVNRGGVRV